MEYTDISYDTMLPECNNNDPSFHVKDSSQSKKAEIDSQNKVHDES